MKPLIYLAGPLTYPNHGTNVRRAILMADVLVRKGFVPFIPHLSHFWDMISPKPRTYEFWLDLDYNYILRCDALYRMSGKSKGADKEVEFALRKGIPVFFKIEDLERWRDETFNGFKRCSGAGCNCSANSQAH